MGAINKIIPGEPVYDEIYGPLRKKVSLMYILGWAIVTLFEAVFGIVYSIVKNGTLAGLSHYFIFCVIIPAGADAVIIAIALALISMKKIPAKFKNYVLLESLIWVATVLSSVHGHYVLVFSLFVIPIFLTSIFFEYRFLIFTFINCVIGLAVSTILVIYVTGDPLIYGDKFYLVTNVVLVSLSLILFSLIAVVISMVHRKREMVLSQVQTENAKLSKENRVDGLTGLQNHTSFYTVLENKLAKSRHNKTGFALAMLDIDDFKDVNDTYGHAAGDEILKFVSETLVNTIAKNGVVFRYGGDEFAIIFHNPLPDANVELLEQIRMTVEMNDTMLMNGNGITLSIGYYNVKEAIMSSEEIFYRADQALYQAKYNGKNQVYSVF